MDERTQFAQVRWDLSRHRSHVAQLFTLGRSASRFLVPNKTGDRL